MKIRAKLLLLALFLLSIPIRAQSVRASLAPALASPQVTAHLVGLAWTASTSASPGYNVYRSTVSGGPYTKQNAAVIASVSYTDSAVMAATTYFYVVTAVSAGVESLFSNQVSAAVPADAPGTTAIFGSTSAGANTDTFDSNNMNGSWYTSGPAAGTATSCGIWLGSPLSASPNNKGECIIYTDNNGVPGTVIAHSASITLTANAQNIFPITFPVSANTKYWIMYNTNGLTSSANDLKYDMGGAAAQFQWMHTPFGTYPAFVSSGNANLKAAVSVTYTTGVQPPSPPTILTASIPAAQVGKAYSTTLVGTCGVPTCTWMVSGLPAGLTATAGVIAGTPTAAGTSSVVASYTDSEVPAKTATVALSLTVSPVPQPAITVICSATLPFVCTFTLANMPSGTSGVITGTIGGTTATRTVVVP